MSSTDRNRLALLLQRDESAILNDWIASQTNVSTMRPDLIKEAELRQQSRQVLDMLSQGIRDSGESDFEHPAFDDLRGYLNDISQMRAVKGYTTTENATYVLALRNVVIPLLSEELGGDADALISEMNSSMSRKDL